jgi:protein-disulfide isomerase
MLTWRARGALAAVAALNLGVTTCRSPGDGNSPRPESEQERPIRDVTLPGVDTSSLTTREKKAWSRQVSEQLAPCPDQPVSIAECVSEKRNCKACLPAAKFALQAVQRGMAPEQVEALMNARFAPDQVRNIDLEGSPSKGPANAPVLLVEWADFECPACDAAVPAIDGIYERFPGKVRVVFKHFPLAMHPNAEIAARAAVAAQGQGKFWKMHAGLFAADPPLTRPTIDAVARQAGLDMQRFVKDLESEETADAVARDRKQGEAAELTGTPTVFVNGRRFVSLTEFDADLRDWVELELEIATGQKPAPVAPTGASAAAAPPPSGSAADPMPAPSGSAPVSKAPAP